jgi:aminobenzoyl-glutamate transport protein
VLVVVLLATLLPGAPLRDPETGSIIGQTPFMSSLLFIVMLFFFIPGVAYGTATGAYKNANDVIGAVVKTFSGLAGMIFMLLMIAQFIAYFNYTNMPSVIAMALAGWLGQAGIPAIPLLIGFVLVILLLDFIIPGALAKWAIFAPIFVPLFVSLGVPAQTVFAAYRIGDSPANTLTPLLVYFPVIVTFAQRYQKNAGVGSVVALMIPIAGAVLISLGSAAGRMVRTRHPARAWLPGAPVRDCLKNGRDRLCLRPCGMVLHAANERSGEWEENAIAHENA